MKKVLTVLTVFIVMAVLSVAVVAVFAAPPPSARGTGDITFRGDTQIIPPPTNPVDPTDIPTPEPTPTGGWEIGLEGHNISFGNRLLGANYVFRTTDADGVATLQGPIDADKRYIDILIYNMSLNRFSLQASRTDFTPDAGLPASDFVGSFYLYNERLQELITSPPGSITGGTPTTSQVTSPTIVDRGILVGTSATNMVTGIPTLSWVGARWSGALELYANNDWDDIETGRYTTEITWTLVVAP